jgi:hypothetical protein
VGVGFHRSARGARTFLVVVGHERFIDLSNLFLGLRGMDEQTFVLEGAVISFDKGIEIRSMRRTHDRLNAQTPQEPAEGGGEIAPAGCPDESEDRDRR